MLNSEEKSLTQFFELLYRPRGISPTSSLLSPIIALEGIDQAGKRTQARLLANHLRRTGAKVTVVSFPIYDSSSGRLIRNYLKDKLDYSPEALHMLYSLNRWENLKLISNLVARSDFVIADRYTPSNLAYGVSRGLRLDWLRGLDKGLPTPRLVIVLDVSVHYSFNRKTKNRDVHERDERFLNEVKRTYRVLARRLGWRIVDSTQSVEEVHATIWKMVTREFTLPKRSDDRY